MSIDLRLRFPPVPDHMADHAGLAVVAMRNVDGVELDFSVESLVEVDSALGRFHDEGLDDTEVGETVFAFGAYIGEVIRRHASGHWVDPRPNLPVGDWPLVELPDDRLVNPVGKAFKRLANGEVDSVVYFYRAVVAPS